MMSKGNLGNRIPFLLFLFLLRFKLLRPKLLSFKLLRFHRSRIIRKPQKTLLRTEQNSFKKLENQKRKIRVKIVRH